MTGIQHSRLNMIVLTCRITQSNADVLANFPRLTTNLSALSGIADQIDAVGAIQQLHSRSAAGMKEVAKKQLVSKMLRGSRAIKAYAKSIRNPDLQTQFHFVKSALQTMKDHLLLELAANVHNFTSVNESNLTSFNCTRNDITALLAAMETFRALAPEPSENIMSRSEATLKLAGLFAEANELLEAIDLFMDTLIDLHDDVYTDYKLRRRLIKPAAAKYAITGSVANASGAPLKGAAITVDGFNVIAKSGPKGNFRIASLPDGVHTLRINRPGYQELVHTTTVVSGSSEKTKLAMREI